MRLTRMRNVALLLAVTGTIVVGLSHAAPAAGQDAAHTQATIDSAMSAAPASISAHATILEYVMDGAGKFVVLQDGSNDWSCFPDDTNTPGNDPMCLDPTWMDWLYAIVAGDEPTTAVAGIAYMLQGGSTPSNTDPLATAPAAGEEWLSDPPHIMLLLPGALDQSAYSTDHDSGEPYIMWAGTPYEHLMVPMAEHAMAK
jgi:hypothetical protein